MSVPSNLVATPVIEVEEVKTDFEQAALGLWYWVNDEDEPLLMCVFEVGSNYVELKEPECPKKGARITRVHRDNFSDSLTFEPDASKKIQERVQQFQEQLARNMEEIQRLTENLGIAPELAHYPKGDSAGKSVALLSDQVDVGTYKNALIEAKSETLPTLFKKNTTITTELSRWMGAASLPMKARLGQMKESVQKIDDRLFNIHLYSGMLDTVFTLSEGQPAAQEEKLRIMQRKLYMDEECLLDYQSGGMDFKRMEDFDDWLAKPVNRDRILPFPRCMVSMQVRRKIKDRDEESDGLQAFINFQEAQTDKFTFMFIRNGEQLYRICTDIEFGELMFPAKSVYDPSEPMMMELSNRRVKRLMPQREYDSIIEQGDQQRLKAKPWRLDNPEEEWCKANPGRSWNFDNPYRRDLYQGLRHSQWEPFDDSSVYFDQGVAMVQTEIKEFNRIALVVQGLFDRTTTLAPHQPVKMWQPTSFNSAVELIYDSSMVLNYGEAPDIDAYINACNAQTTPESVMYGQELAWMEHEAEKENRRTDRNWRISHNHKFHYKKLAPYGDPGPGRLARMSSWKPRSKVAVFTWQRERRQYCPGDELVKAQIKVPVNRLFNVSAYRLGDYLQFFADPRTRAKYLKWAPMLLSAEEFHRGELAINEPYIN